MSNYTDTPGMSIPITIWVTSYYADILSISYISFYISEGTVVTDTTDATNAQM